jgi:ribulose-phosphate 3-epimerase
LAAGADVLVAGSAIFSSRDYAATIAAMRAAGQPSSTTQKRVSAHR